MYKKKLVSFIYVSNEKTVEENIKDDVVFALHMANLKYFSNVFDKSVFVLSFNADITNRDNIIKDYTSYLISIGFNNELTIRIEDNTSLREVSAFHEYVIHDIKHMENDLVFFSHFKGLSNKVNNSLLSWINAMYYFALSDVEEMENMLISKRKIMYGFPLTIRTAKLDDWEIFPQHKYMYVGTFFWINPACASDYLRSSGKTLYEPFDRFYAEEMPGNIFHETFASTISDTPIYNFSNLYNEFNEQIEPYLNFIDNTGALYENFNNYHINILSSIGCDNIKNVNEK